MEQYIKKSALVAEIEKKLNSCKTYSTEYVNGKKYALKSLLSFLDTLEVKEIGVDLGDPKGDIGVNWVQEEPVSNDLEEAACEYDNSHIDDNNLAFKAGAKWQKEQMITKACNYLFSHMGLFVTYFDDDIVEDIERSEFIKKFRIAMEDKT